MAGLLVVAASQLVGFLLLIGDPLKAFLALIVPEYALFALNRNGHYISVVGSYLLGAASLGVGTILLL